MELGGEYVAGWCLFECFHGVVFGYDGGGEMIPKGEVLPTCSLLQLTGCY